MFRNSCKHYKQYELSDDEKAVRFYTYGIEGDVLAERCGISWRYHHDRVKSNLYPKTENTCGFSHEMNQHMLMLINKLIKKNKCF